MRRSPPALPAARTGLLSSALGATNLNLGLDKVMPTDKLAAALTSIPQLGVSGNGGLVQDVLGKDIVGNLIGTQAPIPHVVAGGESGLLGKVLDGAAPLTNGVQTVAAHVAVAATVQAVLNAGTPANAIATAVQTVTSAVPGVSAPLAGITGALSSGALPTGGLPTGGLPIGSLPAGGVSAVPVVGNLVAGVTSLAAPVTNNLLTNVTGSLPVPGGATALTDTLKSVVNGSVSGGLPKPLGSVLGGLH